MIILFSEFTRLYIIWIFSYDGFFLNALQLVYRYIHVMTASLFSDYDLLHSYHDNPSLWVFVSYYFINISKYIT